MLKGKTRKQNIRKRSVYKGSVLRCTEYEETRYDDILPFEDGCVPNTQIFVNYNGKVAKEHAMLIRVCNAFLDIDEVENLDEFLKLKKKSYRYCDDDHTFLKLMPNNEGAIYVDSDNLKRYFEPGMTKKLTFNELKEIRNKEK